MLKIRSGFVSNSSSCSFLITNKSDKAKDIADFCRENMHLVDDFNSEYRDHYTHAEALTSALAYAHGEEYQFAPGEQKVCVFGDEHGTVLGIIYDYILRHGGESKNWRWSFDDYLR